MEEVEGEIFMFSGNNGSDNSSEITGTVKKVTNSPAGGKRVEVDAKFEMKMEMDDPSIPSWMKQKKPQVQSSMDMDATESIKIDMSNEEAKNFNKDDEIRARIQEKYSRSSQGMGSSGSNVYNHVETLSGSKNSSGGSSGGRMNRFGKHNA